MTDITIPGSMGLFYSGTVHSGETVHICAGGDTWRPVVYSSGALLISSGGIASGVTVERGGSFTVSQGGMVSSANIRSRGITFVESGGTATNFNCSNGACFGFAVAPDTYVQGKYSGSAFEMKDAALSGYTVFSGGNLIASSGGTATSITVSSGGNLIASSGGTATSITVSSGGSLSVSSGGTATDITASDGACLSIAVAPNTYVQGDYNGSAFEVKEAILSDYTVCSGGNLAVSSGGTAASVTVSPGGSLTVASGGTATDVVWTPCEGTLLLEEGAIVTFADSHSGVYYGSGNVLLSHADAMESETLGKMTSMNILSGGTITQTRVSSGGAIMVSSGGTANNTTIIRDGSITVSSGGTAASITVGGSLTVFSGGTATDINASGYISFPVAPNTYVQGKYNGSAFEMKDAVLSRFVGVGRVWISSGGTANDTTIRNQSFLSVESGGTANRTSVMNSGSVSVKSNGVMNSTTLTNAGFLYVESGGTATINTIRGGTLYVESGGTANHITVSDGDGGLYVFSGGTATNVKWTPCSGKVSVEDGATVTFVSQYSGVYYNSGSNAESVESVSVRSGSPMYVMSGGRANLTQVYYGGSMCVSSGGSANNTIVSSGGFFNLYDSGIINSTVVAQSGYLIIHSGGTAQNTILADVDRYDFFSRGVLRVRSRGGIVIVFSGGSAKSTRIYSSGQLRVLEGGTANGTIISGSNGCLGVVGGRANLTQVYYGGSMYVSNGGIANNTVVGSRGSMYVDGGGTANDTIVNFYGYMCVSSGGTANNTILTSGGRLFISGGATVNGTVVNSATNLSFGSQVFGSGTIVSSGGRFHISSGATATDIVVSSGGALTFAVAANTYVQGTSDGSAFEMKDAFLSGYTVNGGNNLDVYGTVHDIIVTENGGISFYSGATADGIVVSGGGRLSLAVASDTYVQGTSNGSAFEMKDAFLSGFTVNGGTLEVFSGGTAEKTSVIYGDLMVYDGGTASDTVMTSGTISVSGGGVANNTTVSGGTMEVNANAAATDITIESGAALSVIGGGSANSAIINSGASLIVFCGATVTDFTASGDARISLVVASDTLVQGTLNGSAFEMKDAFLSGFTVNGGSLSINSDGTAERITVANGGSMCVSNGGSANGISVDRGGTLFISNGAAVTGIRENGGYVRAQDGVEVVYTANTINALELHSTQSATVHAGTIANNVVVNYGGTLEVFSGGTASIAFNPWNGNVTEAEGAVVSYLERNAKVYYGNGGLVSSADVMESMEIESGNTALVYSGGILKKTVIHSNGRIQLSEGGTADGTTIESGGSLEIVSGAVVENTIVKSGAYMTVSNGCAAGSTTVESDGMMFISSGGTADCITIGSGGMMIIRYGGAADCITIESGGSLTVEDGASAVNLTVAKGANLAFSITSGSYLQGTVDGKAFEMKDAVLSGYTVESGCSMTVINGGTAHEITENGGYVDVWDETSVTFVSNTIHGLEVNQGKDVTLHSGTTAVSMVVSSGYVTVFSGGIVEGATVENGGALLVQSGGTATNIVWTPCQGTVTIDPGASVSFASHYSGVYYRENDLFAHVETVESKRLTRGSMYVMSGGTANDIEIWNGGSLIIAEEGVLMGGSDYGEITVLSGGVAINVNMMDGRLTVHSGGLVQNVFGFGSVSVLDGGISISAADINMTVESGGTALAATVNYGYISVGGLAMGTTVNSGGRMYVQNGALASGALIRNNGYLSVNGSADFVTVSGGRMYVGSNGMTENISVTGYSEESRGYLSVEEGGTVVSATVGSYADLNVLSGGLADSTVVNSGGRMIVSDGLVNSVTVDLGGEIQVSGGTAYRVGVITGGSMSIDGGTASGTVISAGASMILNGGMTDSATIRGSMIVTGGRMDNTILRGGEIHISSGGTLTGRLLCAGGVVSVFEGGAVDFDLTRMMPGDAARINDLSVIQGLPVYTITVGPEKQTAGIYLLAEGASEFGESISVRNTDGVELGIFAAGETITISETDYTLNLSDNGQLTLQVGSDFVPQPNTSAGLLLGNSRSIQSGEVFRDTQVLSGGVLFISSGGRAVSTTVSEVTGQVRIGSGGVGDGATLFSGGKLDVSSGGMASNVLIHDLGLLTVYSGGTAFNASVDECGNISIIGHAKDITVNSGGRVRIAGGGSASGIELKDDGFLYVMAGGSAIGLAIDSGARVAVAMSPETYLTGTFAGSAFVIQNGVASGFTVTDAFTVNSGCRIDYSIIVDEGSLSLTGGMANNITVNPGGQMIFRDGIASVVENGGYVSIHPYPYNRYSHPVVSFLPNTFSGLALGSGQSATIHSGTTANSISVASGGLLHIFGGKITGQIIFESGAVISASSSVEINFDISGLAPGAPARAVNLSELKGYCVYSLTVSASQEPGVYSLVDDTRQFEYTITVSDTDGVLLGELSTNAPLVVGDVTYVLEQTGSMLTLSVSVPDRIPPAVLNVRADITEPTNRDVVLTAEFSDNVAVASSLYRIGENGEWSDYNGGVTVSENATVFFKAVDTSGNESESVSYTVNNIRKSAPDKPVVFADVTIPTNGPVKVAATFCDTSDLKQFSLDKLEWTPYTGGITFTENGTVYFRGVDVFGNVSEVVGYEVNNIDMVAPDNPTGLFAVVSDQTVVLIWNASTDDHSGVKDYVVNYSHGGQDFTARTNGTSYVLNGAVLGTWSWSVKAVDYAGNESAATVGNTIDVAVFKPYTVEYSADNFEHVIQFTVTTPSLEAFRMPTGTYQMRVKQDGSSEWMTGDSIVAEETGDAPQLVKSDADGNADVFFANPVGTWEAGYLAQHVGSINDWSGTNEYTALYGKNKLADIIEGSTDANILLMTDDENGDALFVDDIYTALPGSVSEQQSRIAQIDEIRAGAGNDVVDMTSQRFEYIGEGLTIRGGAGNDTIWANKGDNKLFGDAGNDRIVGASGNDIIAGGIGNDRMHGGGGEDVFTFCGNWGTDTVEQLVSGSVTLWFASGDESKWNAETLTYTDGDNSVKVSGVTADKITLKFGDDGSDLFATLSGMGAFFDATTERIFEESGKGILASL